MMERLDRSKGCTTKVNEKLTHLMADISMGLGLKKELNPYMAELIS